MSDVRIITNNVPRPIIDSYQLTKAEKEEFGYLDWVAIDAGAESASFFRYKGRLYDLGEFTSAWGITSNSGMPDHLKGWDGYQSDSFFSAILVRFTEDHDHVVVGLMLS